MIASLSAAVPMPVLSVQSLVVRYRTRDVLTGLDLQIDPGAVFGLLGPNGAGKTTLIRTICGRVRPVSGSIAISGQPNSDRATLARIGLVPQEIALYGHMTVRENLETFARLSGLGARQARDAVAWAEEAAHLSARVNERIEILSGGWKRRVNIAAAILHKPDLLILDEPTVGVDVEARNELHDVIRDLSGGGMGVLLATHDLDQAETLCSAVGFLRDGVIAPQGPPRQLIDEAFADETEIITELRAALTEKQFSVMRQAGFVPSNAGMTWSIMGSGERADAQVMSAMLANAGVSVREIRFRKPGLDTLFVRLARVGSARDEAAA
jgi:ABC-2 type transport system ATP-binding protein